MYLATGLDELRVLEDDLTAQEPQLKMAQQNGVATLKSIDAQGVCECVINPLAPSRVPFVVSVEPLLPPKISRLTERTQ